jgi:hypothetical protein
VVVDLLLLGGERRSAGPLSADKLMETVLVHVIYLVLSRHQALVVVAGQVLEVLVLKVVQPSPQLLLLFLVP